MLALHKLCLKSTARPQLAYFQVKEDVVRLSTGHVAMRIPAAEVFPEGLIGYAEELYFKADLWQSGKFHTATVISRDGNKFRAHKGDTLIGEMTALAKEQFATEVGKFPDIDVVMPDNSFFPIRLGVDAKMLSDITSIFKTTRAEIKVTGVQSPKLIIKPIHPCNTEADILLMPVFINEEAPIVVEGISDSQTMSDLKKENRDLKRQIEDFEETTKSVMQEDSKPDNGDADAAKVKIEGLEFELNVAIENSQRFEKLYNDSQQELGRAEDKYDKLFVDYDMLEAELDDLKSEAAILQSCETHEDVLFEVKDEMQRQLFIEFIECMKEIKPTQLFNHLRNLKELV